MKVHDLQFLQSCPGHQECNGDWPFGLAGLKAICLTMTISPSTPASLTSPPPRLKVRNSPFSSHRQFVFIPIPPFGIEGIVGFQSLGTLNKGESRRSSTWEHQLSHSPAFATSLAKSKMQLEPTVWCVPCEDSVVLLRISEAFEFEADPTLAPRHELTQTPARRQKTCQHTDRTSCVKNLLYRKICTPDKVFSEACGIDTVVHTCTSVPLLLCCQLIEEAGREGPVSLQAGRVAAPDKG